VSSIKWAKPTILVSAAALLVAVFAASLSGYVIWDDHRARREIAVQLQLQTYLADYAALRTSYDNAGFSAASYFDCDAYDLRLKASTAAAMLLSTIETMRAAGDPRAESWARLLAGYPGPIDDFGLLDGYARTDWGRQKLAAARAATPWKRYPKCAEPPISRQPPAVPKGAAVG
jgi:hypothetical protein